MDNISENMKTICNLWEVSESDLVQIATYNSNGAHHSNYLSNVSPSILTIPVLISISKLAGVSLDDLILQKISVSDIRPLPKLNSSNPDSKNIDFPYGSVHPAIAQAILSMTEQINYLTEEIRSLKNGLDS